MFLSRFYIDFVSWFMFRNILKLSQKTYLYVFVSKRYQHLAPWIQQTITNLPSGLFIGHFFSRYKQLIGKSSGLVVSVLFVGSDEEDMNDEYGWQRSTQKKLVKLADQTILKHFFPISLAGLSTIIFCQRMHFNIFFSERFSKI